MADVDLGSVEIVQLSQTVNSVAKLENIMLPTPACFARNYIAFFLMETFAMIYPLGVHSRSDRATNHKIANLSL